MTHVDVRSGAHKDSDRNKPCPCGSGVKAKKCRALHLEDLEEAHRENARRDWELNYDPRAARRKVEQVFTLVAAVSGGAR